MYELSLDLILTNEYPSTSNEYCGAFCEYFNLKFAGFLAFNRLQEKKGT
jgi:hypothetical protein